MKYDLDLLIKCLKDCGAEVTKVDREGKLIVDGKEANIVDILRYGFKDTDMQNGTAETSELRTVKAALCITGRGTVIVVKPLPADMNAANTQVLIQGRLLKIFGIEQSQFRKSEVGIVLGSQINKEEIQVGSSVEFVLKKQ